jgi:hypothetical protein
MNPFEPPDTFLSEDPEPSKPVIPIQLRPLLRFYGQKLIWNHSDIAFAGYGVDAECLTVGARHVPGRTIEDAHFLPDIVLNPQRVALLRKNPPRPWQLQVWGIPTGQFVQQLRLPFQPLTQLLYSLFHYRSSDSSWVAVEWFFVEADHLFGKTEGEVIYGN